MKRKNIIPIIAFLTFAAGTVSIMLPFLPLGWFLYAVTALLLIPYFKPIQRAFEWIATKDRTGFTKRACLFTAKIYRWAKDEENAHIFKEMGQEYEDNKSANDK